MLLLVGRQATDSATDVVEDGVTHGALRRRREFRSWRIWLAIGVVVIALIAVGSSSAGTPETSSVPTAAQTASLTAAQKRLLGSGEPINVVIDPSTGVITSVTAATGSGSNQSS